MNLVNDALRRLGRMEKTLRTLNGKEKKENLAKTATEFEMSFPTLEYVTTLLCL